MPKKAQSDRNWIHDDQQALNAADAVCKAVADLLVVIEGAAVGGGLTDREWQDFTQGRSDLVFELTFTKKLPASMAFVVLEKNGDARTAYELKLSHGKVTQRH
mgnify:CR=1 FL=1